MRGLLVWDVIVHDKEKGHMRDQVLSVLCDTMHLCLAQGCGCTVEGKDILHEEGVWSFGAWSRGPDWSCTLMSTDSGMVITMLLDQNAITREMQMFERKCHDELGVTAILRATGGSWI